LFELASSKSAKNKLIKQLLQSKFKDLFKPRLTLT
jgi:hypothetical protein